jgi:hypothetical protein
VIVYASGDDFFLIHDTTGQRQIFYDTNFSAFGSTALIVSEVITSEAHTHEAYKNFYASDIFSARKTFIYDSTHIGNVKHLLPNHLADINKKSVKRYFPIERLPQSKICDVVPIICSMLKGYMKAIGLRKKLAIPITAGVDSRVVFLSSLDEDCIYYVYRYPFMRANHYDITTAQRLTTAYQKNFEVIECHLSEVDISHRVDFPLLDALPAKHHELAIHLNGSVSEIARNEYGTLQNPTGKDLALLYGYKNVSGVDDIMQMWINDCQKCTAFGYDILDMFYWEGRMATWLPKYKDEMRLFGIEVLTFFNSRDLLMLMLSTPRKGRDKYNNKLFRAVSLHLSAEAFRTPINPTFIYKMRELTTKLKIYNGLKLFAMRRGWVDSKL